MVTGDSNFKILGLTNVGAVGDLGIFSQSPTAYGILVCWWGGGGTPQLVLKNYFGEAEIMGYRACGSISKYRTGGSHPTIRPFAVAAPQSIIECFLY